MAALNREPVIGRYAFYNCTCLSGITFLGTAPTVGDDAFFNVAERAQAFVTVEALSSFGTFPADWNALTVSMSVSDIEAALNDLQAQVAELSLRPTHKEVQDGRPGSVLLSVDSEAGSVTLNFTVEESEDLIT